MSDRLLRTVQPSEIHSTRRGALDAATLSRASEIVHDVRVRGEPALREYAARFDALQPDHPLVWSRNELIRASLQIAPETRELLARCARRIQVFADAQRDCVSDMEVEIPGGSAGHRIVPLGAAGCYAPGGRFPLISSMLMTVVTARSAGVRNVWAASPNPSPLMCAAAETAGADALLVAGGAHAIAALAYGVGPVPRCDVVVGPGNRWVTAAKHVVSADVRIDMLAGPSELLVLADESADPVLVASDLLAQAEHDVDARPMLLTTHPPLIEAVETELRRQLEDLPTRGTAEAALAGGFSLFTDSMNDAVAISNQIAPEHLELHLKDVSAVAPRIHACGCLFIGARTAEVFGDFGAGPNHTLPTGGTARFQSGLSVYTFLRHQVWLRTEPEGPVAPILNDAVALARLEGLEAHARSAEQRR